MPRYVLLLNFTEQGVAAIQDSPKRAEAFDKLVAKHGGKVEQQFWTMGSYDGVVVLTAPSDEDVSAVALSLVRADNVRSTTLRAFDEAEFKAILKKM
jgi:uncharacterized protein with GYD domain